MKRKCRPITGQIGPGLSSLNSEKESAVVHFISLLFPATTAEAVPTRGSGLHANEFESFNELLSMYDFDHFLGTGRPQTGSRLDTEKA